MNRTLSLCMGVLAFALLPALAQQAPEAPKAKVHGHVTNATGNSVKGGTISLSTDGGQNAKYTFNVDDNGDYTGEAKPGSYTLVYRAVDTPKDKMVDSVDNIKLVLGTDTVADDDMTRKEFMDRLTPEEKRQIEETKKKNADIYSKNKIIKQLNGDLKTVSQDIKDADDARNAAKQALGATASKADIDAKEAEIKLAKYTEIETLMARGTTAKPDASVLWAQLCKGQLGLKKFDEAETSCKKALELEAASKTPNPQTQGAVQSDLGEIYARTNKADQAAAAYDEAAKVYPVAAYMYLKNEAVIFMNLNNSDAQAAAADKAIKADPTKSLPYYIKGQALIGKAGFDEKTQKIVLPPDCQAAYQKYLELDPNGVYAADVKGILAQANQKIDSGFKGKKK